MVKVRYMSFRSCNAITITLVLMLGSMRFSAPAHAETHVVSPGQSIQKVIDQSEKGDVIVL